uniref:DUF2451 domain-containing protein n=1 Tax=Heterorhabditis bacteriophora TaxID=37862 RepID=A0A1I7WX58_HETBA
MRTTEPAQFLCRFYVKVCFSMLFSVNIILCVLFLRLCCYYYYSVIVREVSVNIYFHMVHPSNKYRLLINLKIQLTHICQILPVPHADYVDGFIKAYYLPESGLEQWISNHSVSLNVFTFHTTRIWLMEYTAKQMIYLLGVATHVSKKAKTRIINALND